MLTFIGNHIVFSTFCVGMAYLAVEVVTWNVSRVIMHKNRLAADARKREGGQ